MPHVISCASTFLRTPARTRTGEPRTARSLWKGAILKVKMMNLLESKVNRVLRMSQTSKTVRLCAMDMSFKDAMSLHDFLLVNGVCRQLELSFNKLGSRGATVIASALRDNRTVSELRIASCEMGDDGALEFAELIRLSEYLQEIDLGDNGLTDRSGVSLFAAVARSPPMRDNLGLKIDGTHVIRRVMLYKNQFSHQTMQAWGKCIKRHRSLIVDMTQNPVGDHGIESISKVLTKYWDHDRLDMRAMGYGPTGLRPLTIVLSNSTWRTVTSLYLSNNDLGVYGATHLAGVIEKNLSLVELDLSGCNLGNDGVRHLFKALEHNERLELIDLGDNGITDKGVDYIAELLQAKGERALTRPHLYPFALRSVVLATNDITSDGFAVFSSVVTIAHLRSIEVSCCRITDNGMRVLAQYLDKNRTIKLIDVSSNLLTADGIWVISEPLRNNESLEALRVNDNRLADSGVRAIASILKFNLSIREVNAAGNGIHTKGASVLIKVLALRLAPIEVHLHGNPCSIDQSFLTMEEKLKRKNHIILLHH
jgi:Ran GTPase-activating protein (RanGAP) involved in mRNA processing and transport